MEISKEELLNIFPPIRQEMNIFKNHSKTSLKQFNKALNYTMDDFKPCLPFQTYKYQEFIQFNKQMFFNGYCLGRYDKETEITKKLDEVIKKHS